MERYKLSLCQTVYNFDTHRHEIENEIPFGYKDYDSLENMIGYMAKGNDDIFIRIRSMEVEDE